MKIHFIKSNQKKHITKQLEAQFGITNLPYLLIESGKEKIRAYSGNLSKDEIYDLAKSINIELIGLYILKDEQGLRPSIDAIHLLENQISKSIIEITKDQAISWLKGQDLEIQAEQGIIILKHNEDFLGAGKSNGKTIFNYVPKERRIKN
jgi:NOL1/NOP2/fmu family ribosome biogenesis protein